MMRIIKGLFIILTGNKKIKSLLRILKKDNKKL